MANNQKMNISYKFSITDRFTKPLRRMQAGLESFKRTAERVDNADVSPDVNVETLGAESQLSRIEQNLGVIGRLVSTPTVNAQTSKATADIDRIHWKLRALPSVVHTQIKVDGENFRQNLNKLTDFRRDLADLGMGIVIDLGVSLSPVLFPVLASLTAALGSLIPMVGILGGGMLGMASSLTAAAGGAGMLLPFAISLGKELKILNADVERGSDEWDNLGASTRGVLTALDAFNAKFEEVKNTVREPVYDGFTKFLQAGTILMERMQTPILVTAKNFDELGASLLRNLDSEDVKQTLAWFGETAPEAMSAWGKAIGNLIVGFGNLMRAFEPLASDMQRGFLAMTESFRKWTDGLSESKKFEAFIQYVQENGPKLLEIIGNIVNGLVGMGIAFAPIAQQMIDGLVRMTQKFEEWGNALSENQEFQKFIDNVQKNAPEVIELIGRLTDFLMELGEGFNWLGEKILPVLNNFLEWSTALMEAHPNIAKIIAILSVLVSALTLLSSVILITRAAFVLFFGRILLGFTLMLAKGAIWYAKTVVHLTMMAMHWGILGAQALLQATKVAGAWLLTTGASMATAVAKMAVTSTLFVLRWVAIAGGAVLNATITAGAWFIALGPVGWVIATVIALAAVIILNWEKISTWTKKMWTNVWLAVQTAWNLMWGKTKEIALLIYNWVRDKFESIRSTISDKLESAKTKAQIIWQYIKTYIVKKVIEIAVKIAAKFQEMRDNISDKLESAKTKAKIIWLYIKTYTIKKIIELVTKASSKFQEMRDKIEEKMNAAKDKIEEIWNNVVSFFEDIDLFQIGKDIIQGLIDGIGSMVGAIGRKVSSVAGVIPDKIASFLGIKSPSRVTMALGEYTGEGLAKGLGGSAGLVAGQADRLAHAAVPDMSKRTTSVPRRNINGNSPNESAGAQQAQSSESTRPIIVQSILDGKVIAESVNETNAIDAHDRRYF